MDEFTRTRIGELIVLSLLALAGLGWVVLALVI